MEFGSTTISLDSGRMVTFRPATDADEALLRDIYESTRLEELALTNWDASQRDAFVRMQFAAQQAHYRSNYPDAEHLIIAVNDKPTGRLYVAEIASEIRIIDVTLLPEHRGEGVGSAIIERLKSVAVTKQKPLRIYVESFNRSHQLFERLGFVKCGESGFSDFLEWRPSSAD